MQALSWQEFRQKASRRPQRILLADGADPRAVKAAAHLREQGIALPILIGPRPSIEPLWAAFARPKHPVPCMDPADFTADEQRDLLDCLRAQPKYRHLSDDAASRFLTDPLLLGCLQLKRRAADGFIGGATRPTSDTLRAVLSIIGLKPGASRLFGFFLMEPRLPAAPGSSLILMADCAVTPDPSPKQLAAIGVEAARAYRFFTAQEPRVAFLSFSTGGSADHPLVKKIQDATGLARELAPTLSIEGEWQVDAALDRPTAEIKGVGRSPMAGDANVLIVPDLNSGNIAYKLAQRLGGCRAVGPLLWGAAQPANDLSRGCSTDDIVDLAALTALQAHALREKREALHGH